MRVAAVAGLLFYVGMLTVHTPALLLALQLLNAIYIGILAGIGMLYFQDLMPGQAGSATTLYTNTTRVGWIIAGSLAGVVAEIWNYRGVLDCAGDVRHDAELPDADQRRLRRGERFQLKQISDGLLPRTAAHFGGWLEPEHTFGRRAEPKIMHRLVSES